MSNFPSSLKIITPVHIGSGHKYGGLEYLREDKPGGQAVVHRISPETLLNVLGSDYLRFSDWLEGKLQELTAIEDDRQRKRKRTELMHLRKFCQDSNIPPTSFFGSSVYQIAAPSNLYPDLEVSEFPKQGAFPYVPGSEVKGAIRTAVLYELLQRDAASKQWLINKIKSFGEDRSNKRLIADLGNKSYLDWGKRKQKGQLTVAMGKIEEELQKRLVRTKGQGGSDDAQYDLLKFLQVGDSLPFDMATYMQICPVRAINTSKNVKLWQEILVPDIELVLTDLQIIMRKPADLDKQHFSALQQTYIQEDEGAAILAACHKFANDLLIEEKSFFQQRSPNIVHLIDKLSELNIPKAPLLRLGMGQGYLSVTINLLLKNDPKNHSLYDQILIHATRNISYDQSHGGPLPKTRRLVQYRGQDWPLGWVQLQTGSNKVPFQFPAAWQLNVSVPPSNEFSLPVAGESKTELSARRPDFLYLLQQAKTAQLVPQKMGSIIQKWDVLSDPAEKAEMANLLLLRLAPLKLRPKEKLLLYRQRLEEYLTQLKKA